MDRPSSAEISTKTPDFEALSRNIARLVEEAGKATAAYLKPLEQQKAKSGVADEVGQIVRTLGHVAETWLADPQKTMEAQAKPARSSSISGPRR